MEPRGIRNFGTNCYINSIVQCLVCIKDVREFLQLLDNFRNEHGQQITIENDLVKTLVKYFVMKDVDTSDQLIAQSVFNQSSNMFINGIQGDAEEFFTWLVNYFKDVVQDSGNSQDNQHIILCQSIESLFDCQLNFYRICENNHQYQESDMCTTIKLDVSTMVNNDLSVINLIDKYFDQSELTFKCSECLPVQYTKGESKLKLTALPKVLAFQFLLFPHMNKQNKKVYFDEYIRINDHIEPTIKLENTTYRLKSVCFHHGTHLDSGHYTALVRYEDNWFEANDHTIKKVNFSEFARDYNESDEWKTAYLCFYEKFDEIYHNQPYMINDYSDSSNQIIEIDSNDDICINELSQCAIESEISNDATIHIDHSELSNFSQSKISMQRSECLGKFLTANERKRELARIRQANRRKKKADLFKETIRCRKQLMSKEVLEVQRKMANERKIKQRLNPDYLKKEAEQKAEKRKSEAILKEIDQEKRDAERLKETEKKRLQRQDPEFLKKEAEQKAEKRKSEAERLKEAERKRIQRQDSDYLKKEAKNKFFKRKSNEIFSQKEKQNKNERIRKIRNDPLLGNSLREYERQLKRKKRSNFEQLIHEYEQGVAEGPTIVCTCCGGLFFRRSVVKFDEEKHLKGNLEKSKIVCVQIPHRGSLMLCLTCKNHLVNEKYPRLALSNAQLDFPKLPEWLSELNDVEQRMCSPRVPFICVKEIGWDGQSKVRGNVVNVPINIEQTLAEVLPRLPNQTKTLQLDFFRRSDYSKPYVFDKFRPKLVLKALEYLTQQSAFKMEGVKVNSCEEWINRYGMLDECDFFVDEQDRMKHSQIDRINLNQNQACLDVNCNLVENINAGERSLLAISNGENDQSDVECSEDYEDGFANNQQHYFKDDTMIFGDQFFKMPERLAIAPAEGMQPIGINRDEFAEELSFIKIYGGEARQYLRLREPTSKESDNNNSSRLTYAAVCKSEFRRYDRRCAEDKMKIFYSYKKLINRTCMAAIEQSILKGFLDKELTAKDALDRKYLEALEQNDEARTFLRTVRSSPHYWSLKRMEINAMIRQLGPPTFFATFSPNETDWPELIAILHNMFVKNPDGSPKIIDQKEADALPHSFKIGLFKRDPITVARYFENRVGHLLRFILAKTGIFSENQVDDYFWRVEFQYRGSPHLHILLWHKDAPELDIELNYDTEAARLNRKAVVEFIDKYITAKFIPGVFLTEHNEQYEQDDDSITIDDSNEHSQNLSMSSTISDSSLDSNSSRTIEETFDKYAWNRGARIKRNIHKCLARKCNCIDTRSGKTKCKYGFPWPLMDSTEILFPLRSDTEPDYGKYCDLYWAIRELLIEIDQQKIDISFNEFLNDLTERGLMGKNHVITRDDYLKALRTSINRPTPFLRRSCTDIYVNPYNEMLFKRWRGNMDIQFVCEPYGTATYVSAYMLKDNAVTSRVIEKALADVRKGNMSIKKKLCKVANEFQNVQEIGAQECAYTLLGMPVSKHSRPTCFVSTYTISDRQHALKERKQLQLLKDDCTNVYRYTLHEHYQKRPDQFKDMCLADFAAYFDYMSCTAYRDYMRTKRGDESKLPRFVEILDERDDDMLETLIDSENSQENPNNENVLGVSNECYQLKDKQGWIKRRSQPKILRFKRFSKLKDKENFYRVQCMLYLPFDNEKKDIENKTSLEKLYQTNIETIKMNREKYEKIFDMDAYEQAQANIEQELKDMYEKSVEERAENFRIASRRLMKENEYNINFLDDENENTIDELNEEEASGSSRFNPATCALEELEGDFGFHAVVDPNPEVEIVVRNDKNFIRMPDALDKHQFSELMMQLNRRQYIYALNLIANLKDKEPFYHFITGPAGAGKSKLINAIYQNTIRICRPENSNELTRQPLICLLSSFTGKAAFNIEGVTLHSLFSLPLSDSSEYTKLGDKQLQEKIKQFKHVKLLIIDEVSMLNAKMFYRINRRLQDYMEKPGIPFGGVSVICLGDWNQLPPVSGQAIYFTRGVYDLNALKTSELWDMFRIYELTEIMRQRDDLTFAQALQRLGNYGQVGLTNEQIEMFDSRIINEEQMYELDPDTIFLFFSNYRVRVHNERTIRQREGKLFVCRAFDQPKADDCRDTKKCVVACLRARENQMSFLKMSQSDYNASINKSKETLSNEIWLKIGCKYMMTTNQDIEDGMVNGAVGTLKKVIYEVIDCTKMHEKQRIEDDLCAKQIISREDDQVIMGTIDGAYQFELDHLMELSQRDRNYLLNNDYMALNDFCYRDYNATDGQKSIKKERIKTMVRIKRVYIDFGDYHLIGRKVRSEFSRQELLKDFYKFNSNDETLEDWRMWTPIEPIEGTIRPDHTYQFSLQRSQLPIIESEAITIHKSQGQSFSKVCVGITAGMHRAHYYVAFSRARTLNGLSICYFDNNQQSILPKQYSHMTEEERMKIADMEFKRSPHQQELARLRNSWPVVNHFEKFVPLEIKSNTGPNDQIENSILLFVQNYRFDVNSKNRLGSDYAISRNRNGLVDVLMLVETHTQSDYVNRNLTIDGYDCSFSSGSSPNQLNASHGQKCFINRDTMTIDSNFPRCLLIAHNASNQNDRTYKKSDGVELSLFKLFDIHRLQYVFICLVYKHPNVDMKKFGYELISFVKKYITTQFDKKRLYIVGDFNINFNDVTKSGDLRRQLIRELNIDLIEAHSKHADRKKQTFHSTHSSLTINSKIDWIFKSKDGIEPEVFEVKEKPSSDDSCDDFDQRVFSQYETWSGDHRPLMFKIKFN